MPDTQLSFAQKVELFKATASNPQARADFAASRAEVINPLLDEQSTIRAIFQIDPLMQFRKRVAIGAHRVGKPQRQRGAERRQRQGRP